MACTDGHAAGAESAPVSAPAPDPASIHQALFQMLDSLSSRGWDTAKVGLYVFYSGGPEGVQLLNILPGEKRSRIISNTFPPSEEPILREFGLKAVGQKIVRRGSRFITVECFEFATPRGANAAYSLLRRGASTVLKRGDGSSEDSDSISFWQGNYFVKAAGTSEDDDESKEVVKSFADRIGNSIGTHAAPPVVLKSLPTLDRVKGSEKLVMGQLSARRYFQAPAVESLGVEQARTAMVADYQVQDPYPERLKVLYIDYGKDDLAMSAYAKYMQSMGQLQKPISTVGGYRPSALFKLNKRFLYLEVKDRGRLVVITGARKKPSAPLLSRML
ncbi:MAG: DUF6599 family protein [Candidatus Obscuribacterales bacterium]